MLRASPSDGSYMPQTNPFHSLVPGRKLSDLELARSIRLNIEAELDAINLYSAHLEASDNDEANAILQHVMNEEKEHAALFTELIHRLDPEQRKHQLEASQKYQLIISGAPEEVVEGVGKPNGAEADVGDYAPPKQLTVGSLVGQKR
jgi:rubrerythrin